MIEKVWTREISAREKDQLGHGPRPLGDVLIRVRGEKLRRRFCVVEKLVDLLDIFTSHLVPAVRFRKNRRRRHELDDVPEGRILANLAEKLDRFLLHLKALRLRADRDHLDDLVDAVPKRANDDHTVEQVDRHAVRRHDLRPTDRAYAAVRRENDDRRERTLKRTVQVREALDIQHVDLIDEEHARNKLRNTLVNVSVDDFVDFRAQLLHDLGLP